MFPHMRCTQSNPPKMYDAWPAGEELSFYKSAAATKYIDVSRILAQNLKRGGGGGELNTKKSCAIFFMGHQIFASFLIMLFGFTSPLHLLSPAQASLSLRHAENRHKS